ncbi:MAG TPA: nicotinamide riboside transporter PnuC [Bacteroidia bacterium]|nr:nicotinamide riboside transporter PnuC [Bacteroidia bacterium]HNU33165.1 nicotinamide riboside transporter PnuC [Bacteroidia bacterium]
MTTLEIIGFVFGVAGVWLTIKENPWCFPVGLVNVIVSSFLFFDQKLYADVLQQIVYVVLLSYGWYEWTMGKGLTQKFNVKNQIANEQKSEDENFKSEIISPNSQITNISSSPRLLFNCIFVIAASTYILGTLLKWYTDASVPYWDALATSMSFTAQYLVARKKIENWMLWMDVNLLYLGIYIYKELYLYAVLFAVYFVMAVVGYFKWRKEMQAQNS